MTQALAIRRVLLIVNPASRRGSRTVESVTRVFSEAGASCTTMLTTCPGDATQIVLEHASAYDAVFTLGGDGTAMEAVSGLANTAIPIGILPGGTGNILVRSLGIPLRPASAARALLNGVDARIDLGRLADGRRFAIGVGVGVDATMIAAATARMKRRFGILSYLIVGTRALFRLEHFRVRVEVDGQEHEFDAIAVLVANFGTLLHDLVTLGDGIRRDDGLLNVCVFAPKRIRDILRITWRLARKDFRADPCMFYRSGRRIRVEPDSPRMAQADGELIGPTPLDIEVEPLAARLLLPKGRRSP